MLSDGFGGCYVVDSGDEVLPLYGTLSGNSVTLDLPLGGGAIIEFVVTFSGDAVDGTVNDSYGDTASFTATRTSSAAAPVIDAFASSPSAIVNGAAAMLSWSSSDAASVSIDQGIGSQPLSGSLTVTPAETTTYTLTATSPGGSVIAQTTVTVSRQGPRRRAVRP